jgi:virginiamycin B lyase
MAKRMSLLLTLVVLALPAAAEANFVYWTNQNPETTIGRAKINGTGLNNSFIAGIEQPRGVAVDSRFVYWTSMAGGTGAIGRANLDGSDANHQFITTDVSNPTGIAVTSTGIYWTNEVGMGGFSIGRANIDGSSPDGQFINIDVSPCGLAADSRFIYFMDGSDGLGFGRVGLDGSGADPDFIAAPEPFCGLAVDPSYLYWGSDAGNTVGRAPVGGGTAEPAFVPTGTTSGGPFGVAVNPQYVFWGNPDADAIGRANINGGSPNPALIRGATNSLLLAAAPSNKLTFGGVARNKKKGTAKLKTKVPGPGQVTLAGGKKVKQQGLTRAAKGSFNLAIKAKGKAAKALKKKGKTKVGVAVTFTPAGVAGVPNTRNVTLILRRNVKKKKAKK